jgi:hypothetical protein
MFYEWTLKLCARRFALVCEPQSTRLIEQARAQVLTSKPTFVQQPYEFVYFCVEQLHVRCNPSPLIKGG